MAWKRSYLTPILIVSGAIFGLILSGCGSSLLNPPRLEQSNQAAVTISPRPTRFIPAPTPTGSPIAAPAQNGQNAQPDPNPILTLWVNEVSDQHAVALEQMAADLDQNYNLSLEFVLVEERRLPELVSSAAISGTLPDIIIHPVEFTLGWTQTGIFNPQLSHRIINILDQSTFDQAALQKIQSPVTGLYTALPMDGHKHVLIYRQDWFELLDLAPPDSFDTMLTAAETIFQSETIAAQTGITQTIISGLVFPTESDLISTHHTFEHLANANGCELINGDGEVTILAPACLDTLSFYRNLVNNYSPSDVQTDISTVNAYLAGRTGMIITRPETINALAGLNPALRPNCPECADNPQFLFEQSGFITDLSGREPSRPATGFGHLTMMGITQSANETLALRFAEYWFNEGYSTWLAVNPAHKVPLRTGVPDNAELYIGAWGATSLNGTDQSIEAVYGESILTLLETDIAAAPRWGIDSGNGTLMATLFEGNVIAIVLQEMLSGYFTSNQAAIEAYSRTVDLVPNYAFPIDLDEFQQQLEESQ